MEKSLILRDLKCFIDEQKTWLQNTLDVVGWSVSSLETSLKSNEQCLVSCSFNPEHRIHPKSVLKHECSCEMKHGEYPKISDACQVEENQGRAVVVNYFHGLLSFLLERDEKRTVLAGDRSHESNKDLRDSNQNDEKKNTQGESSKCLMELLAAERDAKRRRAAHRGKRVHTNKKSYVEILREVICNQMEALNDDSTSESIIPEVNEIESSQKTIIKPVADCYLGVGSKCYNGNPYKRWKNIQKEEQELIEEIRSGKNEKHSEIRHRGNTSERYHQFKRSDEEKHYSKYRERSGYHDRDRGIKRKSDSCDKHSNRKDNRSDSRSADVKRVEENSDMDYKNRKLRLDSVSDSYKSSSSHKKKRKKSSHERSHKKKHKSRCRDSEDE